LGYRPLLQVLGFYIDGHLIHSHFVAEEVDAEKWRKRSIQVKFEIPYFTVSGA
jgi:hypothetical protein